MDKVSEKPCCVCVKPFKFKSCLAKTTASIQTSFFWFDSSRLSLRVLDEVTFFATWAKSRRACN